ncbi:PAS domain-containing sensor histidine kinase [Shewanella baltica]|uniref:sensor histidine kinase n=1 Tax=Shewanella baltica TaxID=62322 RepID=UPI00217D709B|nr:PAS domain-containing sensor histidine kinase [Shewanella baltica]MCS6261954.1 PAS domain-containing sensor histidine kinase [Shewanella baltica]
MTSSIAAPMTQYWRSHPTFFTGTVLVIAIFSSAFIDYFAGSTIAVLLILQLAVVAVALQCNANFAYFAAVFEATSFNFLFTTPRYSLQMFNLEDILNLTVFLLVALTTSKLAELYRRQQAALEQAQLRNSILLSVSHDLRTPLSTIIGTLTTLKEYMPKLSASQKTELIDSAAAESHRLHQYIENLLQATKLQHGALKFSLSEDAMMNVLHQAIGRFPAAQPRIVIDSEAELPPLMISSSLIEQAIFNVLDNALRYSPLDKPVTVKAYQQGDMLRLDIQDEGLGIAAAEAQAIFELFYRQHPSTDGGAGLGLAVAKGIITAHGGQISAEPVAKGSLIRIALPIKKGEQ